MIKQFTVFCITGENIIQKLGKSVGLEVVKGFRKNVFRY